MMAVFKCVGLASLAIAVADNASIFSTVNDSFCVALPGGKVNMGSDLILRQCSSKDPSQVWVFDTITSRISPAQDPTYCISLKESTNFYAAQIMPCGDPDSQSWAWVNGRAISSLKTNPPGCLCSPHGGAAYEYEYITADNGNDCNVDLACFWKLGTINDNQKKHPSSQL